MPVCDLSIVIPCKGSQGDLDRILVELEANCPHDSWELILVDDGSKPKLKLGRYEKENWIMLRSDSTEGAARSRNLGAKAAQGKHLVFLSLFLAIPDDYINRLRNFITNTPFDYAQHLIERGLDITTTKFQDFVINQGARLSGSENVSIKQSLFTAAMIKADIFEGLRGFDTSMQHYGGHELDLIYRMDKAGFHKRIIVENIPLQRVQVEDHGTIKKRLKEYGRIGLPNLLMKHPELKHHILSKPLLWAVMFNLGISSFSENLIDHKIEANKQLSRNVYRLYLHLLVRNAWAAR